MASINYASKEISCKIVFYGPGLSGKTTNLQYVHQKIPSQSKGKLISLATDQDRTLFFDFLPVDIGKIHGFGTKFQLYTVPGQVYYNATRKLVLRGVDGLVFVADSQKSKMDENMESLENLVENLSEYGYNIERIPLVFQYNKRDLNYISSVEELQGALNPRGLPHFEAVATRGNGVFDTLKCISKLVLDQAKRKQLFPERDAEPADAPQAPVEVDISEAPESDEPVAAVVGVGDLSQDATSAQMSAATAVQQETQLAAEEVFTVTPQAQEEVTQSTSELDKAGTKGEQRSAEELHTAVDGSTIISWSAGKSGRKIRSKGFFLLRWLGKLFK